MSAERKVAAGARRLVQADGSITCSITRDLNTAHYDDHLVGPGICVSEVSCFAVGKTAVQK